MVVVDEVLVVEDVAELGGPDVSGTEEAEVVLVLLVVVVVSATGAGGKPCIVAAASIVVVAVSNVAAIVAGVTVSDSDADVPDSLSLPEEQADASKTAASTIAV